MKRNCEFTAVTKRHTAKVKERVGLYLNSPTVPSWQVTGWNFTFTIKKVLKESNLDMAPLLLHRNLWQHIESSCQPKQCLTGNFSS